MILPSGIDVAFRYDHHAGKRHHSIVGYYYRTARRPRSFSLYGEDQKSQEKCSSFPLLTSTSPRANRYPDLDAAIIRICRATIKTLPTATR
jgi:hypothetical protein